jgi:prolipoprotein diacylglyceryl transferase
VSAAQAALASAGPVLTAIPSPSQGVWYLGPVPLRAYALFILAGIAVAVWLTDQRWRARGGLPGQVADVALWAVPFGIVGGRLYHVISSPDAYFGPDGDPLAALFIWRGGLGIWGAVALGAVGAWIGCRLSGMRFAAFADALAPGLLLAQAIGRLGNWFNQELYGRPTDLPWGLAIDPENRPAAYASAEAFHPTFLYEALWNVAAAAVLLWADRRWRLGHGRVFWGYVVLYTLGRVWIETLRIDPAEQVLGVRLNVWTSLVVALVGIVGLLYARRGRETEVLTARVPPSAVEGAEAPVAEADGPGEGQEGGRGAAPGRGSRPARGAGGS